MDSDIQIYSQYEYANECTNDDHIQILFTTTSPHLYLPFTSIFQSLFSNNTGSVIQSCPETSDVNQFLTIAGDGQVLFWDLRFEQEQYRSRIRVKQVDKPTAEDTQDSSTVEDQQKPFFLPVYRIVLNKIEGVGELGLRQIVLEQSDQYGSSSGYVKDMNIMVNIPYYEYSNNAIFK